MKKLYLVTVKLGGTTLQEHHFFTEKAAKSFGEDWKDPKYKVSMRCYEAAAFSRRALPTGCKAQP